MAALWPWLALAGLGALHGLNPAGGWLLAAGGRGPLRALLPISCGHAAAVALTAGSVALGVMVERGVLLALAGAVFVLALVLLRRHARAAGLALGAFAMAGVHGAGWMLVPALVPFCATAMPGREIVASGSFGLALAALAVHWAAMLAVTGALAVGAQWVAARRIDAASGAWKERTR